MKRILLLAVLLLAGAQENRRLEPAAVENNVAVFFSPKGGCEDAVVDQIQSARKTIDIQAYSFTNLDIAKAAGQAQERGVKVRAILDKKESGSKYSSATYLLNHGIETYVDGKHPIAHNKIILIDGKTVITGSYNFTQQAENNGENLLIITGHPKIIAAYQKNFATHLEHSVKYAGVETKEDK